MWITGKFGGGVRILGLGLELGFSAMAYSQLTAHSPLLIRSDKYFGLFFLFVRSGGSIK